MKKNLIFTVLLMSFCLFAASAFAQDPPGNNNSGICPISYSFKRNNGNGWGVCHSDAQIRVAFNPLPSPDNIPTLTAIYYKGNPLTNVMLPVTGEVINKTQPYVSYCLTGSVPERNNGNPNGNIPPASKLTLEFTYPDGLVCTTDNEVPQ